MDSNRFDKLTKTLASWTSRRRLIGGISGAAAMALVPHAGGVRAQGDSIPSDCLLPDQFSEADYETIRVAAEIAYSQMPDDASAFKPEDADTVGNKVRFDDLVGAVKCTLSQTLSANLDQVTVPVTQMKGLFAAFGAAYLGARLPDGEMATEDSLATPPAGGPCDGYTCVFNLLAKAGQCQAQCLIDGHSGGALQACYFGCDAQFFADFFGNAPLDPPYENDQDCLESIVSRCDGDCCFSRCCPPFCG